MGSCLPGRETLYLTPAVSILTTVYNGEEHLAECIESVRTQRFESFEHVIVDDGSTDGTARLLDALEDERISLVRLARSGRGPALNAGLAACRAELVAILDADDVSYPDRLSVQFEVMQMHPEFAVLAGTHSVRSRAPAARPDRPQPRIVSPRELAARSQLPHSAVMMRREAVEAVGGYDIHRSCLFDYDLWIRLATRGFALGRVEVPVTYHRLHAGQSFERRHRLRYLRAVLAERRRAAQLFGETPLDRLTPFAATLFGLIPLRIRMRLFPLAGE